MELLFLISITMLLSGGFIYILILKKPERIVAKKSEPSAVKVDYDVYIMTRTEKIWSILAGSGGILFLSHLFYSSFLPGLIFLPAALLYPSIKARRLAKKRKYQLCLQFREALFSISASLSAGKSFESAIKEVNKDLSVLYPDRETPIIKEFSAIGRRVDMNEPVENALADFAARSHLEDIENFLEVFITAKRTGGNLAEIMRSTAFLISEKIQIKEEITTILASRKFEQKVLNIMPVVLILILTWSTGDYMVPVFTTTFGHKIMTFALVLLGSAYLLSRKIMDIEV